MPMHDWTRVDPNDYHTFHMAWIVALFHALNDGRLPDGYYAMVEHTTPPIIPDVVTLTDPGYESPDPAGRDENRLAVAVAPPRAQIVNTSRGRKRRPGGRRRAVIRHVRDRRLVAVVEVVSPSNKARKAEFADLIGKSVQLLHQGIHLLLIDPFPPTARDPHGLHAAVWKPLTGKAFVPPGGKPLTVVSYVALGDDEYSAYVEPLVVGDALPAVPLFLTPRLYVTAPLEETYQSAWAGFPAPVRRLLEAPAAAG